MVSPRFYLLLVVLMFAIPADCMHYAGTLTPSECRACKLKEKNQIRI
jgi:hypothetical protein